MSQNANIDLIGLTAEIAASYVSNNNVATGDVGKLIGDIHQSLSGLGKSITAPDVAPVPAVSIRASVKPGYLVCLEDGVKLTMLKRYLRTNYDMSPDEYRAKWGLPKDYPMVAPDYAQKRRELAKAIGLGRVNKPADKPQKAAGPSGKRAERSSSKAKKVVPSDAQQHNNSAVSADSPTQPVLEAHEVALAPSAE